MQVEVIEQDDEKFVVLPEDVLKQCEISDVVDISVKKNHIVLTAVDKERL